MPLTYYQITAPYFCTGLGVNSQGYIQHCAPILSWTKGKRLNFMQEYCERKQWILLKVDGENNG